MRIDADDPMAYFIEVLNLDTHEFIQGCEWADSETGEYMVTSFDFGQIKRELKHGNIVLVYKGE